MHHRVSSSCHYTARRYGVFQVKRELLLIISVELTLQVPANADMYVVLSTKVRSGTPHLPLRC